jgi:hypothetical protein
LISDEAVITEILATKGNDELSEKAREYLSFAVNGDSVEAVPAAQQVEGRAY